MYVKLDSALPIDILKLLAHLAAPFQDAIKASLSKIIKNTLKDTENPRLRENAVSVVASLTEKSEGFTGIVYSPSFSQCPDFCDIVHRHIQRRRFTFGLSIAENHFVSIRRR
jgi:hypothetical protein